MLQRFKQVLEKSLRASKPVRLLLAVSGGVDSTVLCDLCSKANYSFSIAHCNFRLRGEESERDAQFVASLAKKYKVDFFIKEFDTDKYAEENKLSIQESARKLRYDWFNELINSWRDVDGFIITAHHADDNAETLLMNFCRGTGLAGLRGIPAIAGRIRRPLLQFSRKVIMEYASTNGLDFVEDSSNSSDKYTRNHFRLNVIPSIREVYPSLIDNLNNNAIRFQDIGKLFDLAVGRIIKKISRVRGNEIHIPVKQLMEFDSRALIYALISPRGFTEGQIDEILKLSKSESGRYITSADGKFRIIRHRHWFIISPVRSFDTDHVIIEESDEKIYIKDFSLILQTLNRKKANETAVEKDTSMAFLDKKQIEFPLLLRRWKQGDYFYPLGMKKKKKLSRFFIDQKLSKSAKENIWVVEMDRKIVWVVGHRIDERFRVTDSTASILKISSSPLPGDNS